MKGGARVINNMRFVCCVPYSVSELRFHVVGEGVVQKRSQGAERVYDKEDYINFCMRLLGEPGETKIPKILNSRARIATSNRLARAQSHSQLETLVRARVNLCTRRAVSKSRSDRSLGVDAK